LELDYNFIFWQNIISPHQIDFFNELSAKTSLLLIVDQITDDIRINDTGPVKENNYKKLKIIINPQESVVRNLFSNKSTIHIFSGIHTYQSAKIGFKYAITNNAIIGIMSEPFYFQGFRGFVRLIRGTIIRCNYSKKIKFILTTGQLGVDAYLRMGYKNDAIFQWGYFINGSKFIKKRRKKNIVFVGQLIERKQIKNFTKLFIHHKGFGFNSLLIVGTGPDWEKLKRYSQNAEKNGIKIRLLGKLTNSQTMNIIKNNCILILPSKFDGWGVVTNEALLSGTPVITSSMVGSSVLLDGEIRGNKFNIKDERSLIQLLNKWSKNELTYQKQVTISTWSQKSISPKVAIKYFEKIIQHIINIENPRPKSPWL